MSTSPQKDLNQKWVDGRVRLASKSWVQLRFEFCFKKHVREGTLPFGKRKERKGKGEMNETLCQQGYR